MAVCRSFLVRMRNVSDKCVGNIKTHDLLSFLFFQKSSRFRDNVEKTAKLDSPQMRIKYATCSSRDGWILLQTPSEYVMLTAISWQQSLY
jgi:hypothetical protein